VDKLVRVKAGRKPVLSTKPENDLISYVCWKLDILALSMEDVKRMTVQLAVKCKIPHSFGKERTGRK
jgi:hypothetical protein